MITKEFMVDSLCVRVYENRRAMGKAAAEEAARHIRALQSKKELRMIFAAAPSQNEMLEALIADKTINWKKITAFHMDEYLNLPVSAPQRFSNFLKDRLFDRVPFKAVRIIDSGNGIEEVARYSELLSKTPIDIVCLGIGENGHLAFNDPPVARFDDSQLVKVVDLDPICRQQQVNDGCFASLDEVPLRALTLTIPALFEASHLVCTVPGKSKAQAVKAMLYGPIETACPASILRQHASCTLFLDKDSGGLI